MAKNFLSALAANDLARAAAAGVKNGPKLQTQVSRTSWLQRSIWRTKTLQILVEYMKQQTIAE